jgi:hypothetical protein
MSPKPDESSIVTLPKVSKEVEIQNLKRAKENKLTIGEKHNLKFEFYYGLKGSYYIVIIPSEKPKKEESIDLSHFDVFLEIDRNGKSPETLMLAQDMESLYSGFGSVRGGKTAVTLKLIPHDSFYGKPFSLDFKVNF